MNYCVTKGKEWVGVCQVAVLVKRSTLSGTLFHSSPNAKFAAEQTQEFEQTTGEKDKNEEATSSFWSVTTYPVWYSVDEEKEKKEKKPV